MAYIGKPPPLKEATMPKQAPAGPMAAPTTYNAPAVPNGSMRYSGGGAPIVDQRVSGAASNAQSLLPPPPPQPAASARVSPQIYTPPPQPIVPTPACGR